MDERKDHLPDGQYDCCATLHIRDGKAIVVLNSTFGLQAGATIPLLRKDGNLIIEQLTGSKFVLSNGHGII